MAGRLTYDSEHENDLDALTALAMGSVACDRRSARESLLNSLGVSLLALKVSRRVDLFNRVVMDLKDCLRWRLPKISQRDRLKVAKTVIVEWVEDVCQSCNGARHIFDANGVKMACLVCAGTGKRRYSDLERAQSLEVSNPDRWAKAIATGHFQVSFAVGFAARNAYAKLGSQD
jgi:hypothetical protein